MLLRYTTIGNPELEYEPGSNRRVLRNLLGVKRKHEMDQVEYEALLRAQRAYLERVTPETQFTAQMLCQMHRDWLGEIYEWAGRYRNVDMEKEGFRWPPATRVPEHMERFESTLLRVYTPCRPAPIHEIALRIAIIHAELLFIHPFREGNGRLSRWLADLMAMQANYPPPDYGFTGKGSKARRSAYLQAVIRGYLQDYEPLTVFFLEALRRSLRDME